MSGKSEITDVVGIRLPKDVMAVLKRRARASRYQSVGAYLRHRITYDITRSHHKK